MREAALSRVCPVTQRIDHESAFGRSVYVFP